MMSPGLAALTAPWMVSQLRSAVLHAFVASPGTFQVGGVGTVQTPFWQTSLTVHGLPSSHALVLFVKTQPVTGSQVSVVQTLLSLHTTGVPLHVPPPQVSPVVQAL